MTVARFLPILDSDGNFLPDAALIVLGVMYFPNCIRSARHFARIVAEDAEGRDIGPDELSEVGRLIFKKNKKRENHAHIAGNLALKYTEIFTKGVKPTLNKAVYLTVAAIKLNEGEEASLKSERQVRECYKMFQNVLHLWATQVAFGKLFQETASSEAKLREFLAIASIFETLLSSGDLMRADEMWAIPECIDDVTGIKLPEWSDEFTAIFADYHPALLRA